ncbi:MAG TPA: PxKF domain-containing protein [Pyrinomonadaceae bacterium]|nr:PxKF domain-containing protein [Pyrinomonadaceae bacterium]
MKSRITPSKHATKKTGRARPRGFRRASLALALALPAALLLIWSGSAAASCNFLMTLATVGSAPGQVLGPRGVATDSAGNAYVVDQNDRVQKFNSAGAFVSTFATGGSGAGSFVSAADVAVDVSNNVYVADGFPERTSGIVQKFNSSGGFVTSWGTQGSGNGQFIAGAAGLDTDSAGNVYVADPGNHRVQKFTSGGTFITSWGVTGPAGVAVDDSDNVYVTDGDTVKVFTSAGAFVRQFGSSGSGNGQLDGPRALDVDASGNVYVADTNNNRIEKFDNTGAFVSSCGSAGNANDQFAGPQGIAVDTAGNTYVTDTGNDRVQKFGPESAATPPTANAGPDQTVECAGALTSVTLNGTGSTAGSNPINSYSWSEGATNLGSGSMLSVSLPAGSHTITLTVTDSGGGSDTDDVVVQIVDTQPPTINVTAPNPMTVECHTTFVDPGATATDACAGPLPVNTSGTVDANTPGTYTINYSATDGTHTATASRTVNVVDTTPPVISCPANIVVTLPANSSATSMAVSYPAVTASDSCAGSATVNSSPASGSTFPVGTTTVNATANDGNGNTASCSFTVTVLYNFAGFFQPVANPPTFNIVNAGRAVPIKFSLSGNKGLSIFAAGSPSSGPVACNSNDDAAVLVDTITAGSSSLTYDPLNDQYVYVWKTDPSWAGTCRQLVVTLNDGSVHTAYFKFR